MALNLLFHFSVFLWACPVYIQQLSGKQKSKTKPQELHDNLAIIQVNERTTSPSCSYRLWFRWRVR